jgi:NitT/TauT family transport system substrate-binding protein
MRGLFAFLAALALGGSAQAQIPAEEAAHLRLVVAAQRAMSNGPLFYAAARDFFRDEGIVVEIKFVNAAQQGANAAATGEADLAAVELSAPVMNFAGRGAIKAIAGQAREKKDFEGASLLATIGAANGGFTDIGGMQDRSLAIPQLGSIYHYQAGLLARAKNVPFTSVTLKPVQTVDAMVAALLAGQAESAILPAEQARSLAAANRAREITWVSTIGEPQLGALFASPRAIETKRALIERFVRAYQRGANDYAALLLKRDRYNKRIADAKSREAALAIAPMVFAGEASQRAASLIETSTPYADPQARIDVADFQAQFAWFKAEGLLDPAADVRNALDLSFLKSAANAAQ